MSEVPERFTSGDARIVRSSLSVSATDSTILRGYCYKIERVGTGRKKSDKRSNHPLLCIPDELGTARDFHNFVLWLQGQTEGPTKIYVMDRRGRGLSDHADLETYSLDVEGDDLVSWCDALGLHHVDILATGQGVQLALKAAPKRPSMISALIMHDGAPEQDGVGIARTKAMHRKMGIPENLEEGVSHLQELVGDQFPALETGDWETWAKSRWNFDETSPVEFVDPKLLSALANRDLDAQQPALWPELMILRERPATLIRGEHSNLVTKEIAKRLDGLMDRFSFKEIAGQGHSPLLHSSEVQESLIEFLRSAREQNLREQLDA